MMRIGIEAQRLFRPHKHGMDRVALELIKNLQVLDKENDYFVFVKPDQDTAAISKTSNFTIVEIPGGPYPIWEQLKLPKIAKAYNCDILHCTSNTAPFANGIPLVTTLHDIIYMEGSLLTLLLNKASVYQKWGNLYRRLVVGNVVKNSKRLITVSNFEKENITKFFKLRSTKKLQSIHNGVSDHFKSSLGRAKLNDIKIKYGLPNNYLLHIANKDPRKNTKKVLKAFHKFSDKTGAEYQLVMLGYNINDLSNALDEIKALELINRIVLLDYVCDEDLPAIYSLSQLFLFPSLREGFGIPIIEAMACGVPVITSNTSSMPEIAGEAAFIVDPTSTDEILYGIIKITSDEPFKNELIHKGLKRSKQFSWNKMAVQVLELYKQLYKEIKT